MLRLVWVTCFAVLIKMRRTRGAIPGKPVHPSPVAVVDALAAVLDAEAGQAGMGVADLLRDLQGHVFGDADEADRMLRIVARARLPHLLGQSGLRYMQQGGHLRNAGRKSLLRFGRL